MRMPLSRWARSQPSIAAGPPSAAISWSVARLSLWMIIASISERALPVPIESSSRRMPESTCERYIAATAIFIVLAIGKAW